MRTFYLVATIIGTILPYFFFGAFIVETGFDVVLFIQQIASAQASLGFVVIVRFIFSDLAFSFQENDDHCIGRRINGTSKSKEQTQSDMFLEGLRNFNRAIDNIADS